MIRAEVIDLFLRAREVLFGGAIAALGLWALSHGGYLLVPFGLGVMIVGGAIGLTGWRRMRFSTITDAPGVVEVDEGQIRYLGPQIGGEVGLPDLAEIRLVSLRGKRLWRLRQVDGQTILIPIDALGADALFDAFASLPGIDMGAFASALAPQVQSTNTNSTGVVHVVPDFQILWRRPGRYAMSTA